jgi:LPS-assembly protein
MKRLYLFSLTIVLFLAAACAGRAQQEPPFEISAQSTNGQFEANFNGDIAILRNGVVVSNRNVVLTADTVIANQRTGEVQAEGSVTIVGKDHIWRGTNIVFNFKNSELRAGSFKTGQAPFYISGEGLSGIQSNKVYRATNAIITSDNYSEPAYRIRARSLTLVPGQYFEARDATLFVGDVPVFYFPYLHRSFARHPNNFEFTPGYRSTFGPYLLSTYNWYWNEKLDGSLHLDWRQRRGLGGGPDFNYHLGKLGNGEFSYYYAHDEDPDVDKVIAAPLPEDRKRLIFTHQATLASNLTAKIVARYQSDPQIVRDFFESEYRKNVQPSSFAEVNQLWPNFSLDVLAQPQINDFFETVERLPDIKLSALRQQVGATPIYYEGENSFGYFRRKFATGQFAGTNLLNDFSATRADTFHQLVLPKTLFGWLNVTPRVGGRVTYYSETDGLKTNFNEQVRGVFNTGVEVSAKASRIFRGAENKLLDVHELRHIVEPSINYVYVPSPTRQPPELPQFDYEIPSLRLLPIDFPDYNAIDSIDSQDVLRLTLRNKLQTKREDGIDNLVNWAVYTDWRLKQRTNQTTFADLFSDLDLKPRDWMTINSQIRIDIANARLREAYHSLIVQPNNVWSVSLSHRYLRNNDPAFVTLPGQQIPGNNTFMSSVYYRLNENWAARISHRFEGRDGTMEEQYYTIYRDLRSWTAALTLRWRENRNFNIRNQFVGRDDDFTVAVTFSLKAFPRFGLGSDSEHPAMLLGN